MLAVLGDSCMRLPRGLADEGDFNMYAWDGIDELTFKEIESAKARGFEKRKEMMKLIDTIFQLQCELDFFRSVGQGLSGERSVTAFGGGKESAQRRQDGQE